MQPLRTDDGQAAVCVAQHQHGVGLDGNHELVALRDDVAHRLAQIRADGVHIDLGVGQLQVVEEHAVQVVVVVLAGVGKDNVKIFAGLVDDGGQTDDLRAGADDDKQFQLAVVFKGNAAVVRHTFLLSSYYVQGMQGRTSFARRNVTTGANFRVNDEHRPLHRRGGFHIRPGTLPLPHTGTGEHCSPLQCARFTPSQRMYPGGPGRTARSPTSG